MRIEKLEEIVSSTFFILWGYEVSYLEFIASIASFIGVGLGVTGRRITWPWWAISSALYGVLFFQWDLFASALLQIVFIAAAIAGWFGWQPSGAKPGALRNNYRIAILFGVIVASLLLAPLLMHFKAAAAMPDSFLFFGSLAAQILMVYEKFESWMLWFVVDAGYVLLYASQGLLFTTVLYAIFTVLAIVGWSKWFGTYRRTLRSH
jgi:nicotinamide mononucleotide transporter